MRPKTQSDNIFKNYLKAEKQTKSHNVGGHQKCKLNCLVSGRDDNQTQMGGPMTDMGGAN